MIVPHPRRLTHLLRRVAPPAAAAALIALLSVGCTTPTYVNVPAQRGDTALNGVNSSPVRQASAAAVTASQGATGPAGNYEVILPDGATPETYAAVVERLPGQALLPGTQATAGVRTYEVRGVRLRGTGGEVDVIRPGRQGRHELVTVRVKWRPFSEWTADGMRVWHTHVTPTWPSQDVATMPTATQPVDPAEAAEPVPLSEPGAGAEAQPATAPAAETQPAPSFEPAPTEQPQPRTTGPDRDIDLMFGPVPEPPAIEQELEAGRVETEPAN
jgi:hypothetical protein